ncbi:hypothetical protein PGB90_010520 [Kerria lacca]
MYSSIYKKTLNKMPGAFFLVGGALTAPAAVIFWKREKEIAANDAEVVQKQIQTISSSISKPKKNSKDFVLPNNDFDLRTILDRRTHTHRGSAQFIGIDNASYQTDRDETT